MKTKLFVSLCTITATVLLVSCAKEAPITPIPPIYNTGNLFKMEDVLYGVDQSLIALINKVRGSVGKRTSASKTIWSRKNDYNLGLYITANHVYNITGWTSRNAQYLDPVTERLGIFETCQIPPKNGDLSLGNILSSDFPLMHFDISATATNTTVNPAEDFYLGIVDNQKVVQKVLPQQPTFVQTNNPLEMFDPSNRTKADKTWNTPIEGNTAVVVGYPKDEARYPNGAVARGKILSNSEALAIIAELKNAGDSEGEIPYNAEVEFFVQAKGIAGMSGGGAFNSDGQLLGIAVRASETEKVPWIIRIVKTSYIRSKMLELYNSLPPSEKEKVRPFISGEI